MTNVSCLATVVRETECDSPLTRLRISYYVYLFDWEWNCWSGIWVCKHPHVQMGIHIQTLDWLKKKKNQWKIDSKWKDLVEPGWWTHKSGFSESMNTIIIMDIYHSFRLYSAVLLWILYQVTSLNAQKCTIKSWYYAALCFIETMH